MTRDKSLVTTTQALDALRAEGQAGLPLEAQSRLAARLQTAVVLGECVSTATSIVSHSAAPVGAVPATSAVDRFAALLASHPLVTLVTTLSVGAFVGASAHSMASSRSSAILQRTPSVVQGAASALSVTSPIAQDTPSASIDDLPLVVERERAAHPPDPRRPRPSLVEPAASALPRVSTSIGEQLALLERARAALGRGDSNAALGILGEHAREYPTSALSEEREALTIQALSRAGRAEEAKARLARFEARFPGSLMLSALKGAVGVGGPAAPSTGAESP